MGKGNRKRSRDQFEEDLTPDNPIPENVSVGATLAHLRTPELPAADRSSKPEASSDRGIGERTPGGEDWTTVSKGSRHRRNKRRRKENNDEEAAREVRNGKSRYPGLTYTELHKLHSITRLGDLQTLLLYCLAEGTAPQWVSVRHHAAIRKAVVLMVPGLEKGMFDGTIPLAEPTGTNKPSEELKAPHNTESASNHAETESNEAELTSAEAKSHVATQTADHVGNRNWDANMTPDDYLPFNLDDDKLPASLQPLADIFVHLWPVKAPGDEKFSKVHSPLHAMLTAPVPKSQEEKEAAKNINGPKPPSASKYWENKPTPINTFLASKEDLQENDYTLHPAAFGTEEEKSFEVQRRKAAKETAEDGWIDTSVEKLEDGDVAESSKDKGSLTAGRAVFAMDCEMCTVQGGEAALTRISLVDWGGTVVMDELVKPDKPIIDYLTP